MVTEITNRLSIPVSQTTGSGASQVRQEPADQGQATSQQQEVQGTSPQTSASTQLTEAVSNINNYVQNVNRDLQFSIDETTERVVIKVLDSTTEEVIREIPSEEALALARYLTEQQETESTQPEGLIIQVQA